MDKKSLLVSLVSDQTIPNVQIIKEFDNITNYLFVTSEGMEKKGTRRWIINTCNIKESNSTYIEVNEYDFSDISQKLESFNFDSYNNVIVNLTGGTKVMTMVAEEFFKNIGADIYYVTGRNNEYIKVFPKRGQTLFSFSRKTTLSEYLTSYGFTFSQPSQTLFSLETARPIVDFYSCDKNLDDHIEALKYINQQRSKEKGVSTEKYHIVKDFLTAIHFNPAEPEKLNKKEVKYLSGEWFEEFVGLSIKKELNLNDDNLFIGCEISKEISSEKNKNKADSLLGGDAKISNDSFTNEMDVMFMYDGRFYSIECKSSIIAFKTIIDKDNNPIEKPYNILGETIYKSDSLKNKFGLFPQTTIMTLTDFEYYWKRESTEGQQNNKIRQMEELIRRANLSNIKLVDRGMISTTTSLFNLIK